MNPSAALQMFDHPEVAAAAREVGAALQRVVRAVEAG